MVDNIYKNHLLHYEHAVFYASNNKLNGVAKTIDNMFSVVKDRIQDQAIEVENMSMFECFTDPFIEGLPPILMIMLPAWGYWKAF